MGRRVRESTIPQGVDESVQYEIAAVPAPVSAIAAAVYDVTTGAKVDVTDTVLDGTTVTIQDGRLVLPLLRNLEARHQYRVEVLYSDGRSTLEPWFLVVGEE